MLHRGRFPDVEGILEAIDAAGHQREPPKTHEEHERKYEANGSDKPIPYRTLEFQHHMFELIGTQNAFTIEVNEKFGGVDEYFEFTGPPGHDTVLLHRMRFGSNRSGRYTAKMRSKSGDNTARPHITMPLSYRDYHKMRQVLLWQSDTVHGFRHSLVGQSGDFWFVNDTETRKVVEIVLYKAGRAEPDAKSPLLLLAEIAPKGCASVEEAVVIIEKYEKLLRLNGRRINKSNMELFSEL